MIMKQWMDNSEMYRKKTTIQEIIVEVGWYIVDISPIWMYQYRYRIGTLDIGFMDISISYYYHYHYNEK